MRIGGELENFASAFFSGVFLCSAYLAISKIREIIKHRLWLVNLEDGIYWSMAFTYLFVQIYHTNNGAIRGYYVLGVVGGVIFLWKISRIFSKLWIKFVHRKEEKRVDKSK